MSFYVDTWGKLVILSLFFCYGNIVHGNAGYFLTLCARPLEINEIIMGVSAETSLLNTLIVMRNLTPLNSGDFYIPGETLTVSYSEVGTIQNLYETQGATFDPSSYNNGCSDTRTNRTTASLIMPLTGTVTLKMGWNNLGNLNPVLISPTMSFIQPTSSPTDVPSASPSSDPTLAPVNAPTLEPTLAPVDAPTLAPVNNPTLDPVDNPTLAPISSPTVAPVDNPTLDPALAPVDAPTLTPINSPTPSPVDSPTLAPINTPTLAPINTPTLDPALAPIDNPTFNPTANPTSTPTQTPTFVPSNTPISTPTSTPLSSPVFSPSFTPTRIPTLGTVQGPSVTPTVGVTSIPTVAPSTLAIIQVVQQISGISAVTCQSNAFKTDFVNAAAQAMGINANAVTFVSCTGFTGSVIISYVVTLTNQSVSLMQNVIRVAVSSGQLQNKLVAAGYPTALVTTQPALIDFSPTSSPIGVLGNPPAPTNSPSDTSLLAQVMASLGNSSVASLVQVGSATFVVLIILGFVLCLLAGFVLIKFYIDSNIKENYGIWSTRQKFHGNQMVRVYDDGKLDLGTVRSTESEESTVYNTKLLNYASQAEMLVHINPPRNSLAVAALDRNSVNNINPRQSFYGGDKVNSVNRVNSVNNMNNINPRQSFYGGDGTHSHDNNNMRQSFYEGDNRINSHNHNNNNNHNNMRNSFYGAGDRNSAVNHNYMRNSFYENGLARSIRSSVGAFRSYSERFLNSPARTPLDLVQHRERPPSVRSGVVPVRDLRGQYDQHDYTTRSSYTIPTNGW